VRLTDPKGNSAVYGPYGFYPPGHATSFTTPGFRESGGPFLIRTSATQIALRSFGAIEFTITD
jgi:hypothetical protein